jgi:hypothetical protein
MAWAEIAGLYVRKYNGSVTNVGVRNGSNQITTFDSNLHAVEAFFDRITPRTIDSFPDVAFDAVPPPVKPGAGLVTAGIAIGIPGIVMLLLIPAVNSSEALTVGGIASLLLVTGGILGAIGMVKQRT